MGMALLVWGGQWGEHGSRQWGAANLGVALLLGTLLLMQLPRALRWRPRRSKRTPPEVVQERQRIAHDLHDHVGSQIVAAMALVDVSDPGARPLVQSLEQCLLDLRLLVDSMDGDDDGLPERLARLRYRLQPALDRRGIALRWEVALEPGAAWPAGQAARECVAIVREAVSNAIQHSGATELRVALQGSGGRWRLQVADNGCGLAPQLLQGEGGGQGLHGMRRRANALGAQLQLHSAPEGGVTVELSSALPVG
ncbi:ATP-binding protein [Pulveribacter suum]|uniref:histidine kinase n=2 Tax=Pulveribacter suum TaxID=2116657 RepID=A0A2P1NPR4_9BURK|nr:ATP-binding protein [Pulveribacter suum]